MQRQPVISEKDSDQNQSNPSSNQENNKFKKTSVASKFIRSSQQLTLKFNAIIRSGYFKQFQTLSIFYTIINGPNWKLVSGQQSGISQISHSPDGQIIWNFPIQVIYQTDYLASPPQLVFVLYGYDFFGRSVPKVYGNVHFLLTTEGVKRRKVQMFRINQTVSWWMKMYAFFTGSYYQFKEIEKILCNYDNENRANIKAISCGSIQVEFDTKRYNFDKYGYDD